MLAGVAPDTILQKGQPSTIFSHHFPEYSAIFLQRLIVYGQQKQGLFKNLKKQVVFNVLNGAEVAQFGRALDSTATVVEGEAEDRVVAGSSPALGTTMLIWNKPATHCYLCFRNSLAPWISQTYSKPASMSIRPSSIVWATLEMYSSFSSCLMSWVYSKVFLMFL